MHRYCTLFNNLNAEVQTFAFDYITFLCEKKYNKRERKVSLHKIQPRRRIANASTESKKKVHTNKVNSN